MNDLERVRRQLVRVFYDPSLTNSSDAPIWCLGEKYDPKIAQPQSAPANSPNAPSAAPSTAPSDRTGTTEDDSWIRTSLESDRREATNGQDPSQYGGWPHAFLDDFESRIWMTYRSGFTPIEKSQDPKATAVMSFRVRVQNIAQSGFTSDSGFGCMIRSGQSILANALLNLKLGRGMSIDCTCSVWYANAMQTGEFRQQHPRITSAPSYPSLLTTPKHPSPSTVLSNMALRCAESFRGSGLAHRQQPVVSKTWRTNTHRQACVSMFRATGLMCTRISSEMWLLMRMANSSPH